MATYKKRPAAMASQQKEKEAQVKPSQAKPSAQTKTEESMQILKSAAHKYVRPEMTYASSLTPEKTAQKAAQKSAVDNFMQRTGVRNALGAPTLRDVQRAMPENFAAREMETAEARRVETPTLDRIQRSIFSDPLTEPGGAAYGASYGVRQEAEDRAEAARSAFLAAQARM